MRNRQKSRTLAANVNETRASTHTQPRRYRSKIDGLLVLALAGVPLVVFLSIAAGVFALPASLRLAMLAVMAGFFGLPLWSFLATHYTIDANTLTVRSGPFRWVIALAQIESVTATRDARSGPALSLDRLLVRYGGGRQMLISPQDKEAFLHDLERTRQQAGGGRSSP